MAPQQNQFSQPIGDSIGDWRPPPRPPRDALQGRYCRLEPLDAARHADGLFAQLAANPDSSWTYLFYGPFRSRREFGDWIQSACLGDDPLFFAICLGGDAQPAGMASYLRITPQHGSIEVGHLHYGPALRRSPAGTEAMYLMMRRAFELGYRRYEWKCDALNAPSRAAAERLGLSLEGVFRQAVVYKGRSRDTAWYAAIDAEWPALQAAFERWLDPDNFDQQGRQRVRLGELTRPIRAVAS